MRRPRLSVLSPLILLLALAPPIAAQEAQKDQKDQMEKEGAMAKDAMDKDAMAKDAMDKDAMGKAHRGSFSGAEGHEAGGGFEVIADQGKSRLRLAPDFSVQKGPDVYVVLSNSPQVGKGGSLYLGKLKKFSGEQVYDIPSGTDLSAYSHVVLWCKKYHVAMGSADLASGHDMMHK